MADGQKILDIDGEFEMLHGSLQQPRLVYETWGEFDRARQNAVLIFTGLSPSAHVASHSFDTSAGWWEDMVGPGHPIDTTRYFVVCVNSLGSCFGSTGPASINPSTGKRYRLDFPVLCLEDIAASTKQVIDHLDIESLHTVVGPSMGGMSALAFVLMYPESTRALVSISAAFRSQPFAIALRSLQRELVRTDPNWNHGLYSPEILPRTGLKLARKLGMASYRSPDEWNMRFGRERITDSRSAKDGPFGLDFEIESYLQAHAEKFADSFDANCYLYLSRAMDLFDVCDHGGSVEHAMAKLQLAKALVVGVSSDILFPLAQQEELATALRSSGVDVDLRVLDSIQGHDSFLVDMARFRPVIADHFNA